MSEKKKISTLNDTTGTKNMTRDIEFHRFLFFADADIDIFALEMTFWKKVVLFKFDIKSNMTVCYTGLFRKKNYKTFQTADIKK